ncbi:hypothetical protein EW145_g971 [Phellinidium pouzarii]|uniref:WD repeat-containing protein 75 second beta-propeller domain-containing protein n=1 Tax=Phellinidium pouzarii TaxID=167371 RepID=A0A4S4LGB5_9AGAM|nr:hypothetical protein EW145_g971 [Phellinidium pouzarii]
MRFSQFVRPSMRVTSDLVRRCETRQRWPGIKTRAQHKQSVTLVDGQAYTTNERPPRASSYYLCCKNDKGIYNNFSFRLAMATRTTNAVTLHKPAGTAGPTLENVSNLLYGRKWLMSTANDLCTMPYDEEERLINQRAQRAIKAGLTQSSELDKFKGPNAQAKADQIAKLIQDLEAQRAEPHPWELIIDLGAARAARSVLLWRLFPINTLPVEIFIHIFSLAIFSASASEIFETRMVLVAVCSLWRSIAIDTPKLWSIIPITCRPPFHLPRLCIERAKAIPLVLWIDQRDRNWNLQENDHKFEPEDMKSLMAFVSPIMQQMRQLVIFVDTWAVVLAALDALQAIPAPRLLERLEIHRSGHTLVEFPAGGAPEGFLTPYRLFGGARAPMLDHINFSGVHIDFTPASFRNLRFLELRKMTNVQMPTLDAFTTVLEESPQLEHLGFEGASPQLANIFDDNNWKPIQLRNLRELVIAKLIPDYAIYILKLIAAPELRRLTLGKLVNEDFTGFMKQLPRRFPKVTLLTVNGLGINDTGLLVAWLRTLPRLRYLRIAHVADEFFYALLQKTPAFPVDSRFAPEWILVGAQLEAIEIIKCNSININALQEFHRTRLELHLPLKKIYAPEGEMEGTPAEEWLRDSELMTALFAPAHRSAQFLMSSVTSLARDSKSSKKAKRKENTARSANSTSSSPKRPPPTNSSPTDAKEAIVEEDTPWAWTTLADSSVGFCPAVFTADGDYFFSVVGTAVRIYSVATGKVVSTLSSTSTGSSASRIASGQGHSDVITAVILNPENPFQLITASLDGNIKIWDFLDAMLLQTIHIGKPISHMCAHENLKGQIFIAVLTKLKENRSATLSLDKGNTMIYRVSLIPRQFSTSQNPKASEIVRIGKSKAAVSMAVSHSGSWLVVVAGHKAYVSLTSSPESGFTKFVSPEKLTCLAFHPVDDYFATGDEQGQIRIWYCLNSQLTFNASGSEKRAQTTIMHWHAHAVSSLAFTPNGAYLLSGGEESVLVIWQLHTGRREFVPRLGSPILTIAIRISKDNEEEYLMGLVDGSYMFISAGSLTVNRVISRIRLDPKGIGRPPHTPVPLAIHTQAATLILPASHPSSLQIYSPGTATLLSELEVAPSNRVSRRDEKQIEASRVDFVVVSSSGEWMATIDKQENDEEFSAEVYMKIWQWTSSTWVLNTRIDRPHGQSNIVAIDFSPQADNTYEDPLLMTIGLDGNVKIWSVRSVKSKGGKVEDFWISRSSFCFRSELPSDARWAPDGSLLAVCFPHQTALYDPHSNLLLDCLLTSEIRKPESIRFVGRSGRYLLTSGRNHVVLWDLVTRTVCWHYFSPLEIAQVLTHPEEDLIAIIVQPYADEGAIRTSKVLHFSPTASKPFNVRTLPFRFRAVGWNYLNKSSRSLLGITYSWNVVLCGDDAHVPAKMENTSREIDRNDAIIPRKTLFQDIFGKSAFIDTFVSTMDPYTSSSGLDRNLQKVASSVFDAPAYLAPPIETMYSSLIEAFLTKAPEQEVSFSYEDVPEDLDEMIVDLEPVFPVSRGRLIGEEEIESLLVLFQKQIITTRG